MKEDPGANRKSLTKRVKARVLEADNETRVATLLSQQRQGHMLRSSSSDFIDIWAKVVQALPPDEQRFSCNSRHAATQFQPVSLEKETII